MGRKYTKSERWYKSREEISQMFKERGHKPSMMATARSIAVRKLKREHGIADPHKYPELIDMFARMWLESRDEQASS